MSCINDIPIPLDWDCESVIMDDEEISATSHEEAGKVLEQWQSDEQDHNLNIMEVDEQIGINLLGDEILNDPCMSPTGPLEELIQLNMNESEIDKFSLSFLEVNNENVVCKPFHDRYKESLAKLAESMQRSQETRKSLSMKTPKTEKYPRKLSVHGVLSSIEYSSQQLQSYLREIH